MVHSHTRCAGMGWAALITQCISMETFTNWVTSAAHSIPSQCVCVCVCVCVWMHHNCFKPLVRYQLSNEETRIHIGLPVILLNFIVIWNCIVIISSDDDGDDNFFVRFSWWGCSVRTIKFTRLARRRWYLIEIADQKETTSCLWTAVRATSAALSCWLSKLNPACRRRRRRRAVGESDRAPEKPASR